MGFGVSAHLVALEQAETWRTQRPTPAAAAAQPEGKFLSAQTSCCPWI